MATNNIKIFGNELQTTYESGKGLKFIDTDWGTEIINSNSKIGKTGFVPNTPVSSLALNTALQQASIGAKLIGDILADSRVLGINVSTDATDAEDLINKINNYSNTLTAYLRQVNGLKRGEIPAQYASYYNPDATGPNSIATALTNLNNNLTAFQTAINNGSTPVGAANYYVGGTNTISAELQWIKDRINQLGNLGPYIPTLSSYYAGKCTVTGGLYRQANIVYGFLNIGVTGNVTWTILGNNPTMFSDIVSQYRPQSPNVPETDENGNGYIYDDTGSNSCGAVATLTADGKMQITPKGFAGIGMSQFVGRIILRFGYQAAPRTN